VLHHEGAAVVGPLEHDDFAFEVGEGHGLGFTGRESECWSGFADFGVSVDPCGECEKEEK
jgi:hypothetical protein